MRWRIQPAMCGSPGIRSGASPLWQESKQNHRRTWRSNNQRDKHALCQEPCTQQGSFETLDGPNPRSSGFRPDVPAWSAFDHPIDGLVRHPADGGGATVGTRVMVGGNDGHSVGKAIPPGAPPAVAGFPLLYIASA